MQSGAVSGQPTEEKPDPSGPFPGGGGYVRAVGGRDVNSSAADPDSRARPRLVGLAKPVGAMDMAKRESRACAGDGRVRLGRRFIPPELALPLAVQGGRALSALAPRLAACGRYASPLLRCLASPQPRLRTLFDGEPHSLF